MADSVRVQNGVDRISALPDDLLCHILSFRPTKRAVCTSILSKRWRCLYTLLSTLDIVADIASGDVERPIWFSNFVDRALLFRSGPSIQRFSLKWHHYINPLQIYGWIGALVCHNIQELELCNIYQMRQRQEYDMQIPDRLLYCETLVVLKLVGGSVPSICPVIPGKASFPNLKILGIHYTTLSEEHVEKLLSSCPVLDDFSIVICELGRKITGPVKLNIFNATLKRLTITFCIPHQTIQVVINCPALVYLNYSLSDIQSYTLLGKPSLSEVHIGGYAPYPKTALYANAHEHDVLKEIKNIQSLVLQDNTVRGFFDYNLHLPIFSNLTYLKIQQWGQLGGDVDPRCLQYLLAKCVLLETLVFEEQYLQDKPKFMRYQYLFEESQLVGLLCHLKKIKIRIWNIIDTEALIKIIEFFLSNAKVLEDVTLLVRDFPDSQQLNMMRELLTLPRVSKNCRVVVGRWRI